MKKATKLGLIVSLFILTFAPFCVIRAQESTENMKTFFDSIFPQIKAQVNATTETVPTGNITVIVSLKTETDVFIEKFNLSIYGFYHGENKVPIANITKIEPFWLNATEGKYNTTFPVPADVWDTAYGEIVLKYRAYPMGYEIGIPNLVVGFTLTHIENIYLTDIEQLLSNLNSTFWQCFNLTLTPDNLASINQTYWELQQNMTALKGSLGDLDNTRRVVAILAVTTVFFVATTVYMVMRKPKESW